MSGKFLQVSISAETQEQADQLLDALLARKLVTGGQILHAPARFLWKGSIVNMDYFNIVSYTLDEHKAEIIREVKAISIEEVPMVSFVSIDGNEELLRWIEKTLESD